MFRIKNISLNIREKIIVGLTICLLVIGFVGVNSYRFLRQIEQKEHLVEVADDLSNIILEIRRYEKTFSSMVFIEDYQMKTGVIFKRALQCFQTFLKI